MPDVIVSPLVEAKVSVPFVMESESCSDALPALTSATLMALPLALEKTSDVFSLTDAEAGAVTDCEAGVIVNVTGPLGASA